MPLKIDGGQHTYCHLIWFHLIKPDCFFSLCLLLLSSWSCQLFHRKFIYWFIVYFLIDSISNCHHCKLPLEMNRAKHCRPPTTLLISIQNLWQWHFYVHPQSRIWSIMRQILSPIHAHPSVVGLQMEEDIMAAQNLSWV